MLKVSNFTLTILEEALHVSSDVAVNTDLTQKTCFFDGLGINSKLPAYLHGVGRYSILRPQLLGFL